MFWLFDKNILKNDTIKFYQIFINDSVDINGNIIYKLDGSIQLNLTNYSFIKINYEIKIIGEIISYKDIDTNVLITFNKKEVFIKPEMNEFNKAIFDWTYKNIQSSKLPELLSSKYDYYYPRIELLIYKINTNLLFIQESNKSSNCTRNYWIAANLDNIKLI